ncbi:MAG: histidine phosphatase family protein [Thermoflexibacter sp.]|nr:histidine phosphatase family protein [Thermoflexibacter sp.]
MFIRIKHLLLYAIVSICIFSMSCTKNESLPDLALLTDVKDSLIVPLDTVFQFNANVPIRLRRIPTNAGSLVSANNDSSTISYKMPTTAGVYTVQLVNKADTSQKIQRTFIVSPQSRLFNNLRAGGYVLVFRHAIATMGADIFNNNVPNWWKSCEATIARQLSPEGRVQAERIGRAIRLLKIPVGKVISSEYCRTIQTAQLMNFGLTIETSQALTFSVYDEQRRVLNTVQLAKAQTINNRNSIFTTHCCGGTTGAPSALTAILTMDMGDASILKLNPNGADPTFIQILRATDLTILVR